MFNSLDASAFTGNSVFYDLQLQFILSKIVDCYQLMIKDKVALDNDENRIRDTILLSYLKNDTIREMLGLLEFHFEREVPEDITIGRTDIKVITANTFAKQAAYYIIECKRINNINPNGKTGLNAEYILNGINRFCSLYYSSFYRSNALIGFVVEDLAIAKNVDCINSLLLTFSDINTTTYLTVEDFVPSFQFAYSSTHLDKNADPIRLYHIMLDLSKNIKLAN